MFHVAVLVAGVILLAVLTATLGWRGVERAVVDTGPWFGIVALIDLAGACCDAASVRAFLSPRVQVPYRTVLAAQLSGMAVNRITPASTLGEPVKVTMLAHAATPNLAISAIVMFNLTTLYVAIATIVIGVPITIALLDVPHELAIAVWIATALLVALAVALAVIVRRGAVATLIGVLASAGAISAARAERWRAAVADIDARLRELGGDSRASGLRRGLIGVVASRVLNWAGTIALLYAAEIHVTPVLVVAMLSVGILVSWLSNIVPLGLGVSDGTNYALYGLLGASPGAGLVYAMVNRLRTLALAMIGLCVMALAHARQPRPARVPA